MHMQPGLRAHFTPLTVPPGFPHALALGFLSAISPFLILISSTRIAAELNSCRCLALSFSRRYAAALLRRGGLLRLLPGLPALFPFSNWHRARSFAPCLQIGPRRCRELATRVSGTPRFIRHNGGTEWFLRALIRGLASLAFFRFGLSCCFAAGSTFPALHNISLFHLLLPDVLSSSLPLRFLFITHIVPDCLVSPPTGPSHCTTGTRTCALLAVWLGLRVGQPAVFLGRGHRHGYMSI